MKQIPTQADPPRRSNLPPNQYGVSMSPDEAIDAANDAHES
jgi:hypothetical protein